GETEWIPPPHLERGQPRVNSFHHPEDMLCDTEDQQDQADQQDGADEEDGAA
ncbi:hypothetical protein JF714_19565, partial [Mycobacterium avium]|nr:hypothetical protein [Mycobacterium avium]